MTIAQLTSSIVFQSPDALRPHPRNARADCRLARPFVPPDLVEDEPGGPRIVAEGAVHKLLG